MSEQQPAPIPAETGSTAPGSPEAAAVSSQPAIAAAPSEALAPEQEETAPGPDAPGIEAAEVAAVHGEVPAVEMIEVDPVSAERALPHDNVAIMPRVDRGWEAAPPPMADAGEKAVPSGKRRVAAMAAVIALAAVTGAIGGALATAGLGTHAAATPVAANTGALEASIARIEADLVALKSGLDQTAKAGTTQFNKTSDRLDKIERAQAEPAAKLARLSDAVEKLRAAAPTAAHVAAATPAGAKDVTGSVTPPATATASAAPGQAQVVPGKPDLARLPRVEGWVLREVGNGSALIQNRSGLYEVYTGDPIPGLGRIDAIRKQDGRWVVVTSKGLILPR